MPVPVIIPARNEAEHIGASLEALSRQNYSVDPFVVVNGCNDETPDIARSMGAMVLESKEGKMPAIQEALHYLGKRALSSLIILDADTKPLSRNWSDRMVRTMQGLPTEKPAVIWGPYLFHGEINLALGAFYTATSLQVAWADRDKDKPRTVRGGNTGLKIRDVELLEELLEMENYWPREDLAIFETSMRHNATKKVLFHPESWVQTSGYRSAGILKKVIKERRHPSNVMDESYANEAPPGSKPYNTVE